METNESDVAVSLHAVEGLNAEVHSFFDRLNVQSRMCVQWQWSLMEKFLSKVDFVKIRAASVGGQRLVAPRGAGLPINRPF